MILSGLDDLWVDFCYLVHRLSYARPTTENSPSSTTVPPPGDPAKLDEALIALWIPAWREDAVIANMLSHNVASIRYRRYHIFAGTYPNDEATLDVLRGLEQQYPNLHVSLTPHDGPTSKADNMNWIYQNLCLVEERLGEPFDIVVIHDSEDLIHPEEFRWLNHYCRTYDFVQIPVLALPTPWWDLTHGVYCDEFAETQQKDLPTRNRLDGFAPSCGVGTGYRRKALAQLAEAEQNRLFEPDSLTEDYLNGLRMHRLGLKQIYLPVAWINGQPVATREYFPRRFKAAIRQRSRWVTGIALQTWQKIGWSSNWKENYWLWRDRKGLIGNPLSLLANVMLVLGFFGHSSGLQGYLLVITSFGLTFQLIRIWWRIYFTALVYGLPYALLVPIRVPWSNLINTLATLSALFLFARARLRNETLVWFKTEHAYPNREALNAYSRRLGEVLTDLQFISLSTLDEALGRQADKLRLGEYLILQRQLSWDQLYRALSLLSGCPTAQLCASDLDFAVARCMPRSLMNEFHLQPVRFENSFLLIASSEIPKDSLLSEIRRFTGRDPLFVLVNPANLQLLRSHAESPESMQTAA